MIVCGVRHRWQCYKVITWWGLIEGMSLSVDCGGRLIELVGSIVLGVEPSWPDAHADTSVWTLYLCIVVVLYKLNVH